MAIIVKKYNVRHNGVRYGPGQPAGAIIVGLSKEEEASLIGGSNGTIEKYEPYKYVAPEADQDNLPPVPEMEPEEGFDTDQEPGGEPQESKEPEMPALDPGELIKPSKTSGSKRERGKK